MIDERIAQRRAEVRDERRRGRLRRTVTLAVVASLVTALVLVERSALVGLEEIRVTGTDRTTPDQVRAAADLDLGTSTLRLRLGAVEERVTTLPLVRHADARRLDPLTIEITVTEREPAVNAVGDGERRLVDRDGVVLQDGEVDGLPEVHVDGPLPPVGASVREDAALANAMSVWRGLSGPLRADVQRYDADGPDELALELSDGTRVRFGRAERLDEKVRALGAVLGDLDGTVVELIDVRAPNAPVVIGAP